MNRKITTTIAGLAALFSLSACNVAEVLHYDPSVVVTDVRPGAGHDGTEGFTPAVLVTCEGANCPTPPSVSYPCVSGQAEGAITEGAGSHICP